MYLFGCVAGKYSELFDNEHLCILHSALVLFAVLNPSISYTQGMNEVMFIIYYTFRSSENMEDFAKGWVAEWRKNMAVGCGCLSQEQADTWMSAQSASASGGVVSTMTREVALALEADVFFCFSNLIASDSNLFCDVMDADSGGLLDAVRHIDQLLAIADRDLSTYLVREACVRTQRSVSSIFVPFSLSMFMILIFHA